MEPFRCSDLDILVSEKSNFDRVTNTVLDLLPTRPPDLLVNEQTLRFYAFNIEFMIYLLDLDDDQGMPLSQYPITVALIRLNAGGRSPETYYLMMVALAKYIGQKIAGDLRCNVLVVDQLPKMLAGYGPWHDHQKNE